MKIDFEETVIIGYLNTTLNIDPHDFLDCETVSDLEFDIKGYYYGNPNGEYSLGDVHIEDSDVTFAIPEEFIEEWKRLKKAKIEKLKKANENPE